MNLHVDTLNIAYFTVIDVKVRFRTEYVDRPGLVENKRFSYALVGFY